MADQTDILKNHTPLDPDRMYADLEEKLKQQVHPVDLDRIRSAYEMAKAAHAGQKRKDGSPYVQPIRHPLCCRSGYCGRHGA